jgi:hypothetical protein
MSALRHAVFKNDLNVFVVTAGQWGVSVACCYTVLQCTTGMLTDIGEF